MVNLAMGHDKFWQQQPAPPGVTSQWGMGFFRGTSAWIMLSLYLSMISILLGV